MHIKEVGDALLNDRGPKHTGARRRLLQDDGLFDDVDNPVDDQTNAAALLRVHDHLNRFTAIAVPAALFVVPCPP